MFNYEARGAEGREEMTIMHRGVFMIHPHGHTEISGYHFEAPYPEGGPLLESIDQALVTLAVLRAQLLEAAHPPPTSDPQVDVREHG